MYHSYGSYQILPTKSFMLKKLELAVLLSILIGFCEQNINSTEFIVTYNGNDTALSYPQSTATLRCITGYTAIKPGFAVCGSDGEWIIEYPECEGMYIILP